MTSSNGRTPRPHRQSRKHGQVKRQAVADTRPERQEPQLSDNIEKMHVVYINAVLQRVSRDLIVALDGMSDREKELLDPHIYVSSAEVW